MGIQEQGDHSAYAVEKINEDEDLIEDLDEIRLEDLEAAPTKFDDLKADVQDPLKEVIQEIQRTLDLYILANFCQKM